MHFCLKNHSGAGIPVRPGRPESSGNIGSNIEGSSELLFPLFSFYVPPVFPGSEPLFSLDGGVSQLFMFHSEVPVF